ncbi:MAG: HAD family hydrolase [Erysipelotrichaceae bacterium]|nr:HAD family hydrolase [Erysipelotrichaceae bacterium]
MKRAVIFDLDGTLWDSTRGIAQAWNEVFARRSENKRITPKEVRQLMGLPMDEICRRVYPANQEAEQLFQECADYENEYLARHGARLYDGVEDTLNTLKKDYFLAIVSNCQAGYIEAFLKANGYEELFDGILSYGDTLQYKAENIRTLMEQNGIEQALYVGDIEGDFRASSKAGIPFIFARYGFGDVECAYGVNAFSDLITEVPKVFAQEY